MSSSETPRANAIRALLQKHVKRRLEGSLSKIRGTDSAAAKLRQKEQEFFHLPSLIASGAACAGQIQMATHIAKGVHPDLTVRSSTNLNIDPKQLASLDIVGSHVLHCELQVDATGNGAYNKKAFEVFLLLREKYEGVTVLELLKNGDPDAISALGGTDAERTSWALNLSRIDEPRCMNPASSTLAKQIYWQTGDDVQADSSYHLLSPLYASSLAHRVYETLQDDRFSEAAKAAREARKANTFSEHPVHEYPQMAVQQLGGTKPQNISLLNSERRGNNYLLASLPPVWRSMELKPLLNTDSMFHRYSRRPEVRQGVKALLAFLKTDPARNESTRSKRAAWVNLLIDEFLQFTAELRSLSPGWSQILQCKLSDSECRWLDADGVAVTDAEFDRAPPTDVAERISANFANWLNAQLRNPLPMGDPEFLQWRNTMMEEIKAQEREGSYAE